MDSRDLQHFHKGIDLYTDPFTRTHEGQHGAFCHRVNREHVAISREAVAYRMGVPVGAIVIEWAWLKPVEPVKLRRAA